MPARILANRLAPDTQAAQCRSRPAPLFDGQGQRFDGQDQRNGGARRFREQHFSRNSKREIRELIKTARIVAVAAAVFATAGCWGETEVNGRWTVPPDSVPNMDLVEVSSGDTRRIHVSNQEGRFSFQVSCPGHYAFHARSNPPILVFIWTERTLTGCSARGADALRALPGSAG